MRSLTAFLSLAVALIAAQPALAEGLPQLDPKTFSPQIVWLVISFAVLYVLMTRMALPRISGVLDERQKRIDDSLEKASSLKGEAETAAEAYEQVLADARAEAQGILREARDEMAGEASQRHARLAERLNGEVTTAEDRIATAKQEAMAHVRDMAVEVARAATERLIGEAPDAAAAGGAVERAIKERG